MLRPVMLASVLAACGEPNPKHVIADAEVDALLCRGLNDSIGGDTCTVLTGAGCSIGEKCGWVIDDAGLGQVTCVPAGARTVGMSCEHLALPWCERLRSDDCDRGLVCHDGTCKTICDHQGDERWGCDPQQTCTRYDGLFEWGNTTVAGVCEPGCDPLTQVAMVGEPTAACGSLDSAAPNAGCYSLDFVEFACMPIEPSTLGRTDRTTAQTNGSGTALTSGCAPGFVPFFREATGSNVVTCTGTCAPKRTDRTLPGNNKGDATIAAKLPFEPEPLVGNAVCEPGKKGSEANQNCLYLWPFNFENGMLQPSPYNNSLGVCFAYEHYTYDHDNIATTPPRRVPGCETLPPRGFTDQCVCDAQGTNCSGTGCPDGLAHEWGCYDTVSSGMSFTSPAAPRMKSFLRELRVGAAGATSTTRHVVR